MARFILVSKCVIGIIARHIRIMARHIQIMACDIGIIACHIGIMVRHIDTIARHIDIIARLLWNVPEPIAVHMLPNKYLTATVSKGMLDIARIPA